MLMIRLQRIGKRGQAHFRVVIAEHTKKTKGKFLELLGSYNPHEKKLTVKRDRVEYWMSKGAQITPTVNNLMVNYKIWDREKMQSWKPKVKPKQESTAPAETKKVDTKVEEVSIEKVEAPPEEVQPQVVTQ